MDENKWMAFIYSYWSMLSYWEMIKGYRKHDLQGAFWSLNALACRNELLMRIAHSVHLCEEIAKEYEVGVAAMKTLDEIKVLFARGDTRDHKVLRFDDCGVKPFRDKILAHPLNQLKAVLGKPNYEILLKWGTVEKTFRKIKEFADQVEAHMSHSGRWGFSTYKDELGDVDIEFKSVTRALEDAQKHDKLKLAIKLKGGRATVSCGWRHDDEVVLEQ